jgi:hypothetical protein
MSRELFGPTVLEPEQIDRYAEAVARPRAPGHGRHTTDP